MLIMGSINPTGARQWWVNICAGFMDLEHQRPKEKEKHEHDEINLTQQ